jgi:E3 ubiquitin-protein ligase BRE1
MVRFCVALSSARELMRLLTEPPFPTHVTFRDIQDLELHLADKASSIKKLADSLFARLAANRGDIQPDVSSLEAQVNSVLAGQKDLLVKVARLTSEKDGLSEQLNTATLRYMKAERKLDRLRSTQVQKLEQQALAIATRPPTDHENGVEQNESNGNNGALQLALQESQAVSETQKEQLESALAEAKSLQEQLTAAKTRLASLSDEDYAHTEVFKLAKARVDDLTKRFNHLEADNKTLQAKIGELNGHREAYKQRLESEAQTLTGDLEDQLQQSDTNLARIRTTRDELLADVANLKASKDQERNALVAMKELVSAKEDRISALELELQRLQPSEDVDMSPGTDVDGLSPEELRDRYRKLEQDFASINKELPAVVTGMKKFQAIAGKKVSDLATLEDRVALAVAEKTKADQKYFGVRKFDDTRAEELKRLRTQNAKSSEIISQLKENEAQSRSLVSNLEKQLVDLKQANTAVAGESKRLEASTSETLRRCESFKVQIAELNSLARTKDDFTAVAKDRTIVLEKELVQLKTKLEHTSSERDKYKAKSQSNSSEEEDMLRVCTTPQFFGCWKM